MKNFRDQSTVFLSLFLSLLCLCLLLPAVAWAQVSYPFEAEAELSEFSLHNVDPVDLQNGQLLLQDSQSGDTQITDEDDSGLLGNSRYSGGLDVILQYADHALPASGYSARVGLFLADDSFAWEAATRYPSIAAKLHSAIDYSWFDFSDNAGENYSTNITPRQTSNYLRLLRQDGEVSAWYWYNKAWQPVGNDTISYDGDVRVGVRMYANYQDVYSVKLDHLTINIDQDSDGITDAIEALLGTNPQKADTDDDGRQDGSDLWPTEAANQQKTRIKNRGAIDTQLFRTEDRWSVLVTNLSPDAIQPDFPLSGLTASTLITVAEENRTLLSVKDGIRDTEALPAFATRLYHIPAPAYALPAPSEPLYPSTLTSWVIPGSHELPTDADTLATLPSLDAVKDWEVSHADITFGGGFGERNAELKAAVGYMYNQMLSFNPSQREMYLRDRAEQNGLDYEDFMLHFSEDTVVNVRHAEHSIKTPFYGVPTIIGYTRNENDSGVVLSSHSGLDAGVWDQAENGGALYAYLFEPFDQLQLSLSTVASDGQLVVEYPSAVDTHGVVSEWKTMPITDGTDHLRQDGIIRWTPPSDWQRAKTYNPDNKTGQTFGSTLLAEGGAYYAVRLKWQNGSATIPRLSGVSLKRWLQPVSAGSTHYTIPGWDAVNDTNNDGYVDDTEFANRTNNNASARFRYEARAVPLGSMWSSSSSFCRPNLSNATLRQYIADYHQLTWGEQGEAGAYNDDFFRQLGEDSFDVISGGQLAEYNGRIQESVIQNAYVDDFKATLAVIKSTTNSEWISANISAENLFTKAERLPFIESLDAVLREDYLLPSMGLSGYFGVNKAWDNFALAAQDIKSVITLHHRYGRVAKQANTEANWLKDSESGLALYYLMNVPDKTYFHAWNSSFFYGSNNTFTAPTSFWKAGVPKNFAYQPVDMLQVDIGEPSGEIPANKEAMKYMVKTQQPLSDYTVIGDSRDTKLLHPEIGEQGEVTVVPSHIYYMQRSDNEAITGAPAEMVLARNYTKGLVLFRTSFIGSSDAFMASTSEPIDLLGTYRRVQPDGTLSEPITSIVLQGYEGAILVKEESSRPPVTIAPDGSYFRMIGNKIFDPQGNLFVPKGVNIFPWHGTDDSLHKIGACWNFNTVRLHAWILPDASTDQWKDHIVYVDEPLIFDPDNVNGLRTYDVRQLIESYTNRGIVVLFDVHDLLGKYFEGENLEDYKTFITDFASKFRDNPYVWIDLHNEPGTYQGVGNAEQNIPAQDFSRWQTQYTAMREAVRAVAPNMPIFASGNAWGQDTGPNWNGNELVVSEESALLSNADFFSADQQLAATVHIYDQWNYGNDRLGRMSDYFDRVQAATQSPLLIGEYGYATNTGHATEALYELLQQPNYAHMGRLAWTWSANDNNDLTTDVGSHGSGAAIDSCYTKPGNLTRLGELIWHDTHALPLDSDQDGTPNYQDDDDDNDGIPDSWEVEHGLDSTDASDAAADKDGDGKSNLEAYKVDVAAKALQSQTQVSIPASPLSATRPTTDKGVRYDEITSQAIQGDYDRQNCDVSAYWDADRVSVGGRATGNNEDVCKVQAQSDDGALKFLTKWPINNIHYPLTPDAAWAQFRFPIAQNHTAKTVEYDVSWYKLFGSEPTHCHPNERNEATGQCTLDVSDTWQTDIPAGLFLMWAKPGDSEYLVTGPHDPIETIGYSGKTTFQADVPETYQNVDELIVNLVVYNQYTKACDKNDANRCTTHENENLELHAVRLKTSQALNPTRQPAQQHPRLLGDNTQWAAYWQPFDDLSCVTSATDADWGSVFNVKNIWDKNTKGYAACKESIPASLNTVSDADFYLNPTDTRWNRDRALRVLFLLRQMKHCHASDDNAVRSACLYSESETQQLQDAFITYEMNRFTSVSWDWGYACFDLGTEPPMKFWSIFADVFWDDLAAVHKTAIDDKLAEKATCYLDQYANKHWSIFNGNNWTPVLGKGAAYWAMTYYHEDPRAADVLEKVLESLWLHRDFYLNDGAYSEGIVEYTNVSYSSLREINNLMMQGFGIPLASVPWERTEKTADWYLDFMAPDGAMVDFGDSWDKLGWYTLDPLHMLLWEEMVGSQPVGSVAVDACKAHDYFSNKWFQKGLDDPWAVQPSMARDWIGLLSQCNRPDTAGTTIRLFEDAVTGALRQHVPDADVFADEDALRFEQAKQTYLAVSGIPNDFPHRELDFGALIWSAYGNRLLYDFSYGEIAKTAQGKPYLISDGATQLYDNLPLGANTLVVEDATQSGYSVDNYDNDLINSSQIYGERGTLEPVEFGGYKGLRLDSKAVYGTNDDELGWLRYFDRWMLSLEDGNFLVIDAFAVKDNRPAAHVKEYWHTAAEESAAETCSYTHENVAMTLEGESTLVLTPECARLHRRADTSVVGKIIASSLQQGAFSLDDEVIAYPNRVGGTTLRRRARFGSHEPVREDVRAFLLQAAPNTQQLADIQLDVSRCDDGNGGESNGLSVCFDLRHSDKAQTQRIELNKTNNRYTLTDIHDVARDTTPDVFSFSSQNGVDRNTPVISNEVKVTGIDSEAVITVIQGEYSVNGSPFTSVAGTVKHGDRVSVRHTSANGYESVTETSVTIGGVTGVFRSTTRVEVTVDTTPPQITAPANLVMNSKGYKTRVQVTALRQQGSASDDVDGALELQLDHVNGKVPVFRAQKTMLLMRPGRHTITWSATDKAGNKSSQNQQVDLLPNASFLVNQPSSEGQTVSVDVKLNGDAPDYPVHIPFTVTGSADSQDYELSPSVQEIIIEQPSDDQQPVGTVDVRLIDDGVPETNERIVFTMGDNLVNAAKGRKTTHKITILAQNVAPRARLRVSQNGRKGNKVYQNDGSVLVRANAKDANGDALTFEWFSESLVDANTDNDSASFEINPQAHTTGQHWLHVRVSDGTFTVEKRKRIRIKPGSRVVLSKTLDSDGDGIIDNDEPADENGNGILDYREDIGLATSQLLIGQDLPMETEPGLSFETGEAAQSQDQNSAQLSEAQLQAYLEEEGRAYRADDTYTPTLILDYKIHDLEEVGHSASLVIALSTPLPANAVLRKYSVENGWQDFVTDANNSAESAVSVDGNCPSDGSIGYQVGLQTGANCLRLRIQDGGVNDADGLINGTIVDPLAIATKSVKNDDDNPQSSGGSGGMSLYMLLLFFGVWWFGVIIYRLRKVQPRFCRDV